jgi:cytochrome oxidase Cu insertion factor (SCO1/SenC/PrrC family)
MSPGEAPQPPDEAVDRGTPEESFAALVDEVKRHPRDRDRLVLLLPERSEFYAGRSTNAVIRMRGYAIAAFEQVGLPEEALAFVLEELESGRDAYLVAAAARALRGLDHPSAQAAPFLLKAIENITYADDAVSFDGYRTRWPSTGRTTAVEEILKTFLWLGDEARSALPALEALAEDPSSMSTRARGTLETVLANLRADGCCGGCHDEPVEAFLPVTRVAERRAAKVPAEVPMQDQDGRDLTFLEFFGGRPSIVVFFYTRCDNPNKCSLTITKLARLQEALLQAGLQGRVQTAAITYDPEFDLPPRLRGYGLNRGVVFGDTDRFLRAKAGFDDLIDYFDLGVNFGPALVNRHRIELYMLDDEARIVLSLTRLQWEVEEVLRQAQKLCDPSCLRPSQDRGSPPTAAAGRG